MAIEFWLIKGNEKYQFPVPPEEYTINRSNDIQKVTVVKKGELSLWGANKLSSITIQSFFPSLISKNKWQCSYGDPWDTVKKINMWRESGDPIRLLITETDINMEVYISEFEYGLAGGFDINFSLTLDEYKKITIPKLESNSSGTVAPSKPSKPKPSPSNSKKHTVKRGDTLWGISKKYYGDGNKWRTIWNKNKPMKSGNPDLIYPGEVVVIP